MKQKLFQILLVTALLNCAALISAAQDNASAQSSAKQESASDATRTDADETFELNIGERRITERNFAASTSLEAGEESARGLRLRIGVGVGAEQIDVLLRNVRGQVRFRGTLERVLALINSRRARQESAAP